LAHRLFSFCAKKRKAVGQGPPYASTNRRDPVAESELDDAQFYRLSGDTVLVTARFAF